MRYYGQWMRTEAEKRIGHLYPKVKAWQEPRSGQYFGEPDVLEWQQCVERDERCASGEHVARVCGYNSLASFLSALTAHELTVIAWLWARTVRSPNPAFAHIDVPLASTFMLSTKPGKEAWIEVVTGSSEERGVRSEERGDQEASSSLTPHSSSLTSYRFVVKTRAIHGAPPPEAKNGTKLARGANFRCVMSGMP
ncbi:MAG: hypothetical protein RMM29_10060, partial [Planctomycetota bacterium]|nr:hypothetical protein [Planctomycetota bacterium]